MSNFYTNETVTLERQVEIDDSRDKIVWSDDDLDEDVKQSVDWILKNGFKKVCLQFPDHLLKYSTDIAMKINAHLENDVYILADTTYESCCVDYVTAAHINADAIIHCGSKCLSETTKDVPCLYISPRQQLDVRNLLKCCKTLSGKENCNLIILDTPFAYKKGEILQQGEFETDKYLLWTLLDEAELPQGINLTENCNIIFVGTEEKKIMHFYFAYNWSQLYYYSNMENQLVHYKPSPRIIARRSYLIEKVKDSKTIGILVGTLAVHNFLKVIERIKKLIILNGKKYYVIHVGKPTVAKLANFPEIDVYVVITCPMSEIFDSRDFYQPIVTPFDLELALNPKVKKGINNFSPNCDVFVEEDILEEEIQQDSGDVSLISGKIRYNAQKEDISTEIDHLQLDADNNKQIACKTEGTVALSDNFGAGYLASRSWKGLEQNLGQTEVTLAKEGTKGLAQHYEDEGAD